MEHPHDRRAEILVDTLINWGLSTFLDRLDQKSHTLSYAGLSVGEKVAISKFLEHKNIDRKILIFY